MRHQTSKIALSALAAITLLGSAGMGDAFGKDQHRTTLSKPEPVFPVKAGATKPGGTRPTGPGGLKSKPPVALPDFILEPGLPGDVSQGLPNSGFCKRKGAFGPADTVAWKVRFATQGTTAPAGGWGVSQVSVIFTPGGTVNLPLPSPSWNGTHPMEVAIPNGCYSSSACQFTIKVDPANVVPETSNANNNTTKFCAAPAG